MLNAIASLVAATATAALTLAAPPADLEATLADMETAVLAGDPDAYLLHISPADPVFYQEQQNWAADLELHVPTAFDLQIVEPTTPATLDKPKTDAPDDDGEQPEAETATVRAPIYTPDRAIVELRTTWTLGEESTGGDPIERTISFPAVFEKAGTNGTARWLYAGEEWIVIEEGNNRVMCPAGFEAAAEQVAEELPEVRTHVDGLFGRTIDRVQEVKIYPTVLHLQHSIYLSYLDGLGGWNEPGESIKILARRGRGKRSLSPLLAHEYGHVATFELGESANDMPWWLLEGVAEFSGAAFANFRDRSNHFVLERHKDGALADWPALADFRNIDPALTGHVYRQGHHMVEFIAERYTREKMIDWLDRMAGGATIDDASRAALGAPFDEVDAAWRAHVEEAAAAATVTDEPAAEEQPETSDNEAG